MKANLGEEKYYFEVGLAYAQGYLMDINNEKANKYIALVSQTITDCVIATNQTYVETLKQQGKFDAEAQKVAFQMTSKAVLDILSDDAKEYLSNIYGDLTTYVTQLIEAEVNRNK